MTINDAQNIFKELSNNFDEDRIKDGKIIIVIDDISKDVKNYFINMKIQPISKIEVLNLTKQINEIEDRMKVLRIIFEEFRRDYGGRLS